MTARTVPILAAAMLLTLSSPAAAHDPLFLTPDHATPEAGPLLPDGTISFAIYGTLDAPGETRGLQVRFQAGDRLLIDVLIPDVEPENTLPDYELPTVRVTAPDGFVLVMDPIERERFDEPFSGTSYQRLQRLSGTAEAGTYDIAVTGTYPARFTIAVGTTEQFGTPIERMSDRLASREGVTAALDRWYSTPSPGAAMPEEPEVDADTASERVERASPTTTEAAAASIEASEGGSSSPSAAPERPEENVGLSLALGLSATAVAMLVAAGLWWRQRRSQQRGEDR